MGLFMTFGDNYVLYIITTRRDYFLASIRDTKTTIAGTDFEAVDLK